MTFLHAPIKFSIDKTEIEQKALHMLDHFEICLGYENMASSKHLAFQFLLKRGEFS